MTSDRYFCPIKNKECDQPWICKYTVHRFKHVACERNKIQDKAVHIKELKKRKEVSIDYDYKDPEQIKNYYNSLREGNGNE